jgi:hypothetical protein
MYIGMPNKDERINIRIDPKTKEEGWALADLRGLSLSALINHLLVELAHKERKDRPELFADAIKKRMRLARLPVVKVNQHERKRQTKSARTTGERKKTGTDNR